MQRKKNKHSVAEPIKLSQATLKILDGFKDEFTVVSARANVLLNIDIESPAEFLNKVKLQLVEVMGENLLIKKEIHTPQAQGLNNDIDKLLSKIQLFHAQVIRKISELAEQNKHPNYTMWSVYVNVMLYALCFQLQRPIEPFMVEKLGISNSSNSDYAKLQSFFSVIQTVGSLVFGLLLDRFGPKGGFIISFGASALSYGLLASATSLTGLYLSKIPTLLQAGFLCAQAAAAECTSDGADRIEALGRLTVAYTVGSIIGPSVGGVLGSTGNYYLGAQLAVVGSLLSIAITLMSPAPSRGAASVVKVSEVKPEISSADAVRQVLKSAGLLLATKVITSVANSISGIAMPLLLKNSYQLDEKSMGFAMSAVSAVNACVSGFLLGPIVTYFGSPAKVVGTCLICMFNIYVIQAICSELFPASSSAPKLFLSFFGFVYTFDVAVRDISFGLFASGTLVLSMLQYVLSTSLTGASTAAVDPNMKGTLLGLEHSLFAAARIFTPQMAVALMAYGGLTAVGCGGGLFFLIANILWSSEKHKYIY